MSDENRRDIALRELKNLFNYDYLVFSDNEFFQLSEEREEELDNTHNQICKSGYVLYYKKREKQHE
jgi:chromosomal replication initiation ATPase DnaA